MCLWVFVAVCRIPFYRSNACLFALLVSWFGINTQTETASFQFLYYKYNLSLLFLVLLLSELFSVSVTFRTSDIFLFHSPLDASTAPMITFFLLPPVCPHTPSSTSNMANVDGINNTCHSKISSFMSLHC